MVSRTSGENIGDSGLIQAYRAWKAQYELSFAAGNEYILPGLNYTRQEKFPVLIPFPSLLTQNIREQLFFIAFGRIWAQNIKPASAVSNRPMIPRITSDLMFRYNESARTHTLQTTIVSTARCPIFPNSPRLSTARSMPGYCQISYTLLNQAANGPFR